MKRAYWSSPYKEIKPIRDLPISFSDRESATENAGRSGWNLLERTTEPLLMGDNDHKQYEDPGKPCRDDSDTSDETKELLDLLVLIGDEMDKEAQYPYSNFTDYLLLKFSDIETPNKKDYSDIRSYNALILKINNSDLIDRNETIKKITNIYSRTLIMEHSKNKDINKSNNSAYKKTLHRAEQYLGIDSGTNPQLAKEAQANIVHNPILVAKQIKGIIDVMVGRMSPEARQRAYPNLNNRVKNLNIPELSGKKSPGGASIGISITLIKNILNGRDPMFISAVINELVKYL
jgi:hypothetical protein